MDVCNFIRFKQRDGSYTSWLSQNFFIGESIVYDGNTYPYRPIAVATNSSSRAGDRSEGAIAAPVSAITLNVFAEASANNWIVEIKTVKLNRVDNSLDRLLTTEYWATKQVQHDIREPIVTLQLASPLDAVRAPGGRFLSQSLVGALPTSGNLTLQ